MVPSNHELEFGYKMRPVPRVGYDQCVLPYYYIVGSLVRQYLIGHILSELRQQYYASRR